MFNARDKLIKLEGVSGIIDFIWGSEWDGSNLGVYSKKLPRLSKRLPRLSMTLR